MWLKARSTCRKAICCIVQVLLGFFSVSCGFGLVKEWSHEGWSPEGCAASKVAAPQGGAPKGGAAKGGRPKISRFFFSHHMFFLSSLSWGSFR